MPIIPGILTDPAGDPDFEENDWEYETVGRPFEAVYPGRCTIDYSHKVKRGDLVSRVQKSDNPLIPIPGVACKNCTKIYPKAH